MVSRCYEQYGELTKIPPQPGDRSHCMEETSISPQLLSESHYIRVQFGEQSAGKRSDSLGGTSSLEVHLQIKCVSEAAEYKYLIRGEDLSSSQMLD